MSGWNVRGMNTSLKRGKVYTHLPYITMYCRWVSINCRVPFKRWVQVYILVNNRQFQINAGLSYLKKNIKEEGVTTDTARFSSSSFSSAVLSVSHHIDVRHGSSAEKKTEIRLEI